MAAYFLPEPAPKLRTLATGERVRCVFVVEALTPTGPARAAEWATLNLAVAHVRDGKGLSRMVEGYRVTHGGEVVWTA